MRPTKGSAYSSALADLSEPGQRHVLDFGLLPQNNDAMQAEIRTVRDNLLDWSASHESWEIRMWCNIIARELDALSRDPDNLPLRQQMAAKVRDLLKRIVRTMWLHAATATGMQVNEHLLWITITPTLWRRHRLAEN